MGTPAYSDLSPAQRMRLLRDVVLSAQSSTPPFDARTLHELNQCLHHLTNQLAVAQEKAMVRERPFTSRTPLLGALIVRMREAWNWMSTKWWVRPLVEQQNDFNLEVLASLQTAQQAIRASALLINHLATANATQSGEILQLRVDLKALQERMEDMADRNNDVHGAA
jgi:hypothetical protein